MRLRVEGRELYFDVSKMELSESLKIYQGSIEVLSKQISGCFDKNFISFGEKNLDI